ncbi:MAG: SCO family protein [Sphingomonadaceae bacterium]
MNKFIPALALLLVACSPPVAEPPLAGARIGGPFALTDQNGQTITERSFPGQYRLMYFGFTFCPDICPTDVANLARGLKAFRQEHPEKASKVRMIFVTVDPTRDTPAQLKAFTAQFLPDMVGLTGDAKAIEAMTRAYGVAVSLPPGQPKESYILDHSRAAYLMDADNKPIALISHDDTADVIAAELAQWVS